MSRRSMPTTFPLVFKSSSLPSWTKLAGARYPFTVSRSVLRTTTFLWVEGMLGRGTVLSACRFSHFYCPQRCRMYVPCSQTVNVVLFSWSCRIPLCHCKSIGKSHLQNGVQRSTVP